MGENRSELTGAGARWQQVRLALSQHPCKPLGGAYPNPRAMVTPSLESRWNESVKISQNPSKIPQKSVKNPSKIRQKSVRIRRGKENEANFRDWIKIMIDPILQMNQFSKLVHLERVEEEGEMGGGRGGRGGEVK